MHPLESEVDKLQWLYQEKARQEMFLLEEKNTDEQEDTHKVIENLKASIIENETAITEQVAAWKKEHGTVHEITVLDKKLFLKKFTLPSLSLALTFLGRDNIQFAQSLVENNFIGGHKFIAEDADYVTGVVEECLQIVNGVRSSYLKH